MATLAADASSATPEVRRAPAAMTYFSDVFIVGGVALLFIAACVARVFSLQDGGEEVMPRFWHAYLLAAVFGASLSLGGLFFVIAHHVTGGRWGTSVRRLAEIVAGTTFASAALFLPIVGSVLMGNADLFEWNDPAVVEASSILQAKSIYLDKTWFAIRTVAYFAVWCLIARYFIAASVKQDETGEVAPLRRMSRWSGLSVVLFGVAINFAAFDWMMSLSPTWFSTMFGVYYFAGSFLGFLALLMLMVLYLQSRGVLEKSVTVDNRHDIAKLMFAFVVFWAYIAFSQFLLIWYANVPEETEWFWARQGDQATLFGIPASLSYLFILHFFIPFLGFMSSAVRRSKIAMTFWAAYMLVVHWLDLRFVVMPSMHGYEGYGWFAMKFPFEIVCTVGVLGVILGGILRGAENRWLLPVRDPRLKQSMTYHNY